VTRPTVSIVIPVYNEGEEIQVCLTRIIEAVSSPFEIIVVFDSPGDTTVPYLEQYSRKDSRVVGMLNTYEAGAANAIRYGIDHANGTSVVVTMADGSDDPRQIDGLAALVERGVAVAAASRYMPGGQQVGAPRLKATLSRLAGKSLYWLARVGTRDATNSFKGYARSFVYDVGIDSRAGFEMGLELTVKAKRLGLPIAEIPTIWLERQAGISNFKLGAWIPHYLRWYRLAFGPRLTLDRLHTVVGGRRMGLGSSGGPPGPGPGGPAPQDVPAGDER
jgi:dolichol-phosphate mannosyltransferase